MALLMQKRDVRAIAAKMLSLYRRRKNEIIDHLGKVSAKRFRWDMFRASYGSQSFAEKIERFYAEGLNDDHIDSGLKAAVKEFEKAVAGRKKKAPKYDDAYFSSTGGGYGDLSGAVRRQGRFEN